MKFVVFSRATMMAVAPPKKNWALISICEKGEFPAVYENEFMKGRLNLQFHDKDREPHPDYDCFADDIVDENPYILCNWEHAIEVLDFYNKMVEQEVEIIFIHCLMGQCRSAAVAASLSKIFNGDDSQFFQGFYRPNMLVYRKIMDEAVERGLL